MKLVQGLGCENSTYDENQEVELEGQTPNRRNQTIPNPTLSMKTYS